MPVAPSFNHNRTATPTLQLDDVFVFIVLESMGTLAITGNICLIVVLLRNSYLKKASFILMLSLAIADVIHGIVTTSYFYPPIVLKRQHMPPTGVQMFNMLDWTAWSITLSHMSAICLDRLIAIMLYSRYNLIVTVKKARFFTLFCWTTFLSINTLFIFLLRACCLITPLENNHFYTFGYGEFESKEERRNAIFSGMNLFTFTYSPLEMTTLAILSISNPTTLIQLYRRHKRKIALRIQAPPMSRQAHNSLKTRTQWQRASTMLLEMSMRMGSKHINDEVRNLASRRANRQQQRILLQISVVACLFYSYMATYYLLYHVFDIENKWVVLFNSAFYSITHMINPVIYFSLNKEMRVQLIKALTDLVSTVCCIQLSAVADDGDSQRKPSTEPRSSTKGVENSVTITETSPFFNYSLGNNNLRSSLKISSNMDVDKLKISEFSASLKRLVNHNSNPLPVKSDTATDQVTGSAANEHQLISKYRHKNQGFVYFNESSSLNQLTADNEENIRLLANINQANDQQSLIKSIVKTMQQIIFFDSSHSLSHIRTTHSRSLDQIATHKQRTMRLSRTVHAITDFGRLNASEAFKRPSLNRSMLNESGVVNEIDECDNLLRSSLVLLIDDAHTTITTVDSLNADYSPDCTSDDDIIFL